MSLTSRSALVDYLKRVGQDFYMAQGAGGNASLKLDDTLTVKASGRSLAAAAEDGFFFDLPLAATRDAVAGGDRDFLDRFSECGFRPSLEAFFHAVVPHRYVLHLHQIDALALLVRDADPAEMAKWFGLPEDRVIPYAKPGFDLALKVAERVQLTTRTPLVFLLQNHGLIIAADRIPEIDRSLMQLIERARTHADQPKESPEVVEVQVPAAWRMLLDGRIADLARDSVLYGRLQEDWALYPDHVVFLGAKPSLVSGLPTGGQWGSGTGPPSPPLVFVNGIGVFVGTSFSSAQEEQLRCYAEVICRQPPGSSLRSLSAEEVLDLVQWEAELYRRTETQSVTG